MSEKTMRIDPARLQRCLQNYHRRYGTDNVQMSRRMGRADNYLSCISGQKLIPKHAVLLLQSLFGIKYDEYKPVSEAPVASRGAYAADVTIEQGDRVLVRFLKNGDPVCTARAVIREPGDEMEVMQAISYAAHMCYKFAEQRRLSSRSATLRSTSGGTGV